MGSFEGHALPGTLFLLAGLWWTAKLSLWHATHRYKSIGSTRLSGRVAQRRLELVEGSIVVLFSLIGMIAEQFYAKGPHLKLYDFAENHWKGMMNWQHSTMYFFFGLAGGVSLIVHATEAAPRALDKLLVAIAFFNEGFLFLYHLHGRDVLDVHMHMLLLYTVFGCAAVCFLEVFQRGNILVELLRCTLTLLQGSWFWQIGFVLYPLSGAQWDPMDHSNVMFVTMCYSWHVAFAMLSVGVLYCLVSCAVRSRLKKTPPVEMGLLKCSDKDPESEDEVV
ncbi:transmembrane protein 45A [Corythoichthys intestinalis]|uniref:transmembrane protein 45A n=1 Tax=Corythoichthys intestinalis TaxID=161448 RepID=UPI0025A58CF9|nr:transmembrane protein 45A [Corythoichthys intestinalis]XP_061790826.1 transmembrane protein 45A-like [Nerophis lumbriciformis]